MTYRHLRNSSDEGEEVTASISLTHSQASVPHPGDRNYGFSADSLVRHIDSLPPEVLEDVDDYGQDGTSSRVCRDVYNASKSDPASGHSREDALGKLWQAGFSVKQMSALLYEHFEKDGYPQFLSNVQIHDNGGLHRVAELWNPLRVIWFLALVAFVIANVSLLFATNWTVVVGVLHTLQEDIWKNPSESIDQMGAAVQEQSKSIDQINVFRHIRDREIRHSVEVAAAIVGVVEIVGVCWLVMQCCILLYTFFRSRSQYIAYISLMDLCEDTAQQLSAFSAIALMRFVQPAFMYAHYMDLTADTGRCKFVLATLYFVISRTFCLFLALGGFATKTLIVSFKLIDPRFRFLVRWGGVLTLLNNTVKSMGVHTTFRDRVFLFVYGGADSEYQNDERALRNAYRARLGKQICTEFKGQWMKAAIILFTFDHFDLQMLLIEATSMLKEPTRNDA